MKNRIEDITVSKTCKGIWEQINERAEPTYKKLNLQILKESGGIFKQVAENIENGTYHDSMKKIVRYNKKDFSLDSMKEAVNTFIQKKKDD